MRSLWRGAIAFGLVHIPVKVYAATEDQDVRFRQLHEVCHTPIRYQKYCPTCDQPVSSEEIVRGYEYQSGQFVTVDDEALDELPPAREKTVEVLHFVDLNEIDPVYFDRSYYLEPDAGGGRAYRLLQEALRQRNRIALSQVVLRARPRLGAVRVGPEGILTLETLHYPDEIRSPRLLMESWAEAEVDSAELEMALQLVDQRSIPFDPARYQDAYRETLLSHIEARIAEPSAVAKAPAGEPGKVIDLMEALRASLQQFNGQDGTKKNNDKRARNGASGRNGKAGRTAAATRAGTVRRKGS